MQMSPVTALRIGRAPDNDLVLADDLDVLRPGRRR